MAIKEWLVANPKLGIILISSVITLALTLVTKYFTNQNRMKELKEVQKACQIKIKSGKLTKEEMSEINKQMLDCSMEMMKHSFRPMFITLLPILVIFWWVRGIFDTTAIAKTWIWYYIGSAIVASIIFRKLLKVV